MIYIKYTWDGLVRGIDLHAILSIRLKSMSMRDGRRDRALTCDEVTSGSMSKSTLIDVQ